MFSLIPPCRMPKFTVTSAPPRPRRPERALDRGHRLGGRQQPGDVRGRAWHDLFQPVEVLHQTRGDAGRALRQMHIGAVRARRADAEAEPGRGFLAEAHGPGAGRLGVEQAVAEDLVAVMVHQPAGAPLPAGFLVRHDRQGDPAGKVRARLAQGEIGEDHRRRARLHVGGAAAVDAPAVEVAAERIARPALARAGGKDVDMAVQDQMPAGAAKSVLAIRFGMVGWGATRRTSTPARTGSRR